jgi:hypothetical protein
MGAQVFISYSSADRDAAARVAEALANEGVEAWFDRDLVPGDKWAEVIPDIIPRCQVCLPIWSKHAAESKYVEREIKLAENHGLTFFPGRLDNTLYSGTAELLLATVQSTDINLQSTPGLVRAIREHLRSVDIPYPFGRLYRRLCEPQARTDFERHLEGLRLVVRFVALIHAAQYLQLKDRSTALNRAVEKLFTLQSVFSDFDIAQRLVSWLRERDAAVDHSFKELFKLSAARLPGAEAFEESEDAADRFDEIHLDTLCNVANPWDRPDMTPEKARTYWCAPMNGFIRSAISLPWFKSSQFVLSIPRTSGRGKTIEFRQPLELSDEEIAGSRVQVRWPSGELDLKPFFDVVRRPNQTTADVGVLRSQNGRAYFSALAVESSRKEERPPIVLPWGRLEVVRTLPAIFYVGESHRIGLRLMNRGLGAITVPEVVEQLPENLRGVDGQRRVEVASNVSVEATSVNDLSYDVIGGEFAGAVRAFARAAVRYRCGDEEDTVPIARDNEVLVKTLPPPSLNVSRRVRTASGGAVGATVPADTDFSVEVEIRSGGAPVANITIDDQLAGATIIQGTSRVYHGPLDRVDRQAPIVHRYIARVSHAPDLSIRSTATTHAGAIDVEDAPFAAAITPLAPPDIRLTWDQVTRTGADGADAIVAILRLRNIGDSRAHEVRLQSQLPKNVSAEISTTPVPWLAPGADQFFRLVLGWQGPLPGALRFLIEYCDASGHRLTSAIDLTLSGLLQRDLAALPLVGRAESVAALRAALMAPDRPVVCVHGPAGAGKTRVLQGELEKLDAAEARVERHELTSVGSLIRGVTRLIEEVMFNGVPPDERGSAGQLAQFRASIQMDVNDYEGQIASVEALRTSERVNRDTWKSVALLLTKVVKHRGLEKLVLVLRDVAPLEEKDARRLSELCEHLTILSSARKVRIVITSVGPLGKPAIATDVAVPAFTAEECRELIRQVFVLPGPSEQLVKALVEKSELLPANLLSLFQRLLDRAHALLDFSGSDGVRLRDLAAFRALPTRQSELESQAVRESRLDPIAVTALASFRGRFTIEQFRAVLKGLAVKPGDELADRVVDEGVRRHGCARTASTLRYGPRIPGPR